MIILITSQFGVGYIKHIHMSVDCMLLSVETLIYEFQMVATYSVGFGKVWNILATQWANSRIVCQAIIFETMATIVKWLIQYYHIV